jgi:hypothetical protein
MRDNFAWDNCVAYAVAGSAEKCIHAKSEEYTDTDGSRAYRSVFHPEKEYAEATAKAAAMIADAMLKEREKRYG